MEKSEKLGRLHSKLWRFHDEQNWPMLQKAACEFIAQLGYVNNAERAADKVLETFKEADLAWKAQLDGNGADEDNHYARMEKAFGTAYALLGAKTSPVRYKIRWIRASRHKDFVGVVGNIFLEYLVLFGPRRIALALDETYVSIRFVYPAHNTHNWKKLDNSLADFWRRIETSYSNEKKLPLQF